MIPIHEIIFEKVKKIPGVSSLKKIKVIAMIKNRIHQNYMDKRRKNVQLNGYRVLQSVFDIGQELGICFWLDWGTLLGYHREGKIIEHDYDLDVSTWVLDKEKHEKLIQALQKAGFELVREFKNNEDILTETYCNQDVLIDIEYYEGDENKAWTYSFLVTEESVLRQDAGVQYIDGMNLYRFETENLRLKETAFDNGTKCFVPEDIERRIVEEYGPDWKTPCVNYVWTEMNNFVFEGFRKTVTGWRIK